MGARAGGRFVELRARLVEESMALAIICLLMLVTHSGFVRYGMSFNDPSVYCHFGRRLLDGAIPYRDYVFQVGPLPIYVDALFQKVFGATYVASLWAALAIKILRLWVVWQIARRVAGRVPAVLLTIFFGFDPIFAFSYHWSTPYAQLFLTISGLCLVLAAREGRRRLLYLALAGASVAFVVTARQSSAVVISTLLLVVTAMLHLRPFYFTRRRLIALWGGFALAIVAIATGLAMTGALRPAVTQMFIDAPEKKGVHGLEPVVDAMLGGTLVLYKYDPSFTPWSGVVAYLALPLVVVCAVVCLLAAKKRHFAPATIGLLVLPIAIVIRCLTRYAVIEPFSDLPRTFFTVTTILVVLSPARARRWFGVHPVVAIGLGTLPLASDWAMEMSVPGRGWGDATSLVTGLILFALASRRLPEKAKIGAAAMLALCGLVHFGVFVRAGLNPFAKDDSADGPLAENHVEVSHPMLRGMHLSESRAAALAWLDRRVAPGSTCFVYGNLPILYDLLSCKNPTRIDATIADFITAADAAAAIAALEANPPEWIIAQEKSWMNPDLGSELTNDDYEHLNSLNRPASKILHLGLRRLLEAYDVVGEIGAALGPDLAKEAAGHRDALDATRLYRRKPPSRRPEN